MAKVKEPFADVFLWDMKLWEDDSKKMDPKWRSQSDAVFFLIKNDKDDEAHINPAEWMGLPVLPLSTAHENMTQIRTHLTRYRHDDLEKYRSTQTGIYLPRLFWKLADREMSMARQNGESFSILHATMKTPELLEKRFGQAYAQELKLHLALFIQNRIRTCDMVAQAPQGDVLLLLARATNEIAYKVSARINEQLRQSFVRQQTLTLDECPDIAFQIYTYPEHIKSMAELESIVQGVHAA
jgi:GGDEF domain-containing protein